MGIEGELGGRDSSSGVFSLRVTPRDGVMGRIYCNGVVVSSWAPRGSHQGNHQGIPLEPLHLHLGGTSGGLMVWNILRDWVVRNHGGRVKNMGAGVAGDCAMGAGTARGCSMGA